MHMVNRYSFMSSVCLKVSDRLGLTYSQKVDIRKVMVHTVADIFDAQGSVQVLQVKTLHLHPFGICE